MDGLRTLSVLEHEVIPIVSSDTKQDISSPDASGTWLTDTEAQALLRLNDSRRGFCQRVSGGIKLAQYCGIVRLQTCMLEILPKIGMEDTRSAQEIERARGALLTMLHSARLTVTASGLVPQQMVRAPLLDIFIEVFLHSALEQARRGLLCRYVPHHDNLTVLKGRFHTHGHIRQNLARPHLLHCEYDEFTPNNPYNCAIRTTLDTCRTWIRRSATQRLWLETHARYANITTTKMTSAAVAKLPRNRTTRRYATVLTWCEWLLSMASPSLSTGFTQAPGLLFDMNKLFEAYVGNQVEAQSSDAFHVQRQGPAAPLAMMAGDTEAFLLKPDITVWHATMDGSPTHLSRILDAKWKRLNPQMENWGVAQADIYQLLAYAIRYQCAQLELVYPAPSSVMDTTTLPVFRIATDQSAPFDIQIQIRTMQVWA